MNVVLLLSIAKRLWPFALGLALLVAVQVYLHREENVAYQRGVTSMEVKVQAANQKAEQAQRALEQRMASTSVAVAKKETAQQADLRKKLEPIERATTNAIQADPNATCVPSSSVLNTLQSGRNEINSSVLASNPR